jgi:hypothetical protein
MVDHTCFFVSCALGMMSKRHTTPPPTPLHSQPLDPPSPLPNPPQPLVARLVHFRGRRRSICNTPVAADLASISCVAGRRLAPTADHTLTYREALTSMHGLGLVDNACSNVTCSPLSPMPYPSNVRAISHVQARHTRLRPTADIDVVGCPTYTQREYRYQPLRRRYLTDRTIATPIAGMCKW